jgi:hypothetical protein
MKNILIVLMTIMSLPAVAFSFWPGGAAPCNTTLQACIDGSPVGEYIEIRTNSTINENIFANKAVSLVAGNGYMPKFSAGNNVYVYANGAYTVRVKGLTLVNGYIEVVGAGASHNIYITHNKVTHTNAIVGSIRVYNTSNNDINFDISYNQLNTTFSNSPPDPIGAISVYKTLGNGTATGRVYGNTVTAVGIESRGIMLNELVGGGIDMNVIGNEVYGATQGGVYVLSQHNNSDIHAKIGSNAFYRHDDFYFPSGVHLEALDGDIEAEIVNNSMIESRYGVDIIEVPGASVDAYVYNNLVAYGSTGFYFPAAATVTHDYNLVYGVSSNTGYTPGANALSVNPQLVGLKNARLRPGSPAIDSGASLALLALGGSPFIDADGGLRMKKKGSGAALLDIGAYESGDVFYTHVNKGSGSHVSALDHPDLNGDIGADEIHITSNYSHNGAIGPYNVDNEGIFYQSGEWRIFNEGIVDISQNAAFNVVKFGATVNTFEHEVTSSGANVTTLNQSGLDGESQRILQVTQHWTGVYNDHPPGAWYGFGNWQISNFDLANIPVGANYNVYYQEPSKSAWEHVVTTANSSFNSTFLDNPIINGVPCAQVNVTQSASEGVFNDQPVGVWYSAGLWRIYNQDGSIMPVDAAFHVVVSPEQVAACSDLIFKDGFD